MPDTTVKTGYTIRKITEPGESQGLTASADDIYAALDAAWQLYRYTEAPIEIIEEQSYNEDTGLCDGPPRRCATLTVEFLED